jgi:hypothetical protein
MRDSTTEQGRRVVATAAVATALLLGTGCVGVDSPLGETTIPARNPAALIEGEPYRPEIDPSMFAHRIDNPYLPLIPGTSLFYEGISDGERETEVFEVTHRTKTVLGVRATVVRDRVFVGGDLVEDTLDWFAQDRFGNVWYFGESSHDIENGKVVSTEGSWQAGIDGAQPGIVMLAEPRVGDAYRQEFYAGEAEDQATVVSVEEEVEVPAGSFDGVLVTEDRNPLEPRFLESKYYAPGVGVVLEELVRGGRGRLQMVKIRMAG